MIFVTLLEPHGMCRGESAQKRTRRGPEFQSDLEIKLFSLNAAGQIKLKEGCRRG